MTAAKPTAPSLAKERRARKRAERLLEERADALARAEAEIKHTKARFLDFAEIASDWLWEMDADLRFTDLMGYYAETTGLKREDVIGKTLVDIRLFGIDEEATLRQLQFFQERKPFRDSIGKIRNPKGHRHYLNVSGRPIFATDGTFLGYRGTASDITKEIEAERALSDSEVRFRGLAEGSIQGIIIQREFQTVYANQAIADMLGYDSPDEIVAMESVLPLIAPEERDRIAGYRKKRLAGEPVPENYEYKGLRKDGTTIWLESQVWEVDWNGDPATQAAIVDITERKQAEQMLLKSESRFRDFAESAGDWFWEMDEDMCFTYLSPNVARVTGFPPEAYYGKTLKDMLAGEFDPSDWKNHIETLRARKPFRDLVYRRTGEDEAELWVRTSGLPLFDSEGRFTGYRGTGSDVTALKKAEEERGEMQAQLFQAQKMEALGTLAGGVAHDFNNILTIIMGFAELLELDLEDGSEQHRSAKQIIEAGGRATGLVQQILAFTRQQEQSYAPIHLDQLVVETQQLLRASLPSTIDIRADIPKEPIAALGDATQIHQVVMNLCINAGHAIGESPGVIEIGLASCREKGAASKPFKGMQSSETNLPVEIATSEDGNRHWMRIGILESNDCCCLSVRDTGSGMDRATLERAFDPFFTTKEVGKGTGIGLSAVQGIISVHGGALAVESEPGKGTTFNIYLPAATPIAALEAQTDQDKPKNASARILFVDDETALVDVAVKTLEPFGYRVTGMSDSAQALHTFTSKPDDFDLIVTDLTMPKLTGIELARAAVDARADIPVILCTGYSENLDQPGAQAEGVHRLLYKPVFGRKLVSAIEQALTAQNGRGGN